MESFNVPVYFFFSLFESINQYLPLRGFDVSCVMCVCWRFAGISGTFRVPCNDPRGHGASICHAVCSSLPPLFPSDFQSTILVLNRSQSCVSVAEQEKQCVVTRRRAHSPENRIARTAELHCVLVTCAAITEITDLQKGRAVFISGE